MHGCTHNCASLPPRVATTLKPERHCSCRVYSRTCLPPDKDFMHSMESAAVATAAATVALSRSDADFIQKHLSPSTETASVAVSSLLSSLPRCCTCHIRCSSIFQHTSCLRSIHLVKTWNSLMNRSTRQVSARKQQSQLTQSKPLSLQLLDLKC